jgi:hypothetical protein
MDFRVFARGSLPEVHRHLHGLIVTSPQEVGMSPHVLTTYPVSPR